MKRIIIDIICTTILFFFVGIGIITLHQQQLDDYRFEINHLQTKLYRLQELSNYVSILGQILTPLQMAELKTANEQIKQNKYKNYERYELPILNIEGD